MINDRSDVDKCRDCNGSGLEVRDCGPFGLTVEPCARCDGREVAR